MEKNQRELKFEYAEIAKSPPPAPAPRAPETAPQAPYRTPGTQAL